MFEAERGWIFSQHVLFRLRKNTSHYVYISVYFDSTVNSYMAWYPEYKHPTNTACFLYVLTVLISWTPSQSKVRVAFSGFVVAEISHTLPRKLLNVMIEKKNLYQSIPIVFNLILKAEALVTLCMSISYI